MNIPRRIYLRLVNSNFERHRENEVGVVINLMIEDASIISFMLGDGRPLRLNRRLRLKWGGMLLSSC